MSCLALLEAGLFWPFINNEVFSQEERNRRYVVRGLSPRAFVLLFCVSL
jgi:hypothetical protein